MFARLKSLLKATFQVLRTLMCSNPTFSKKHKRLSRANASWASIAVRANAVCAVLKY